MPALLPNARNLIIANAKEILATDGYEKFKMRKLANKCGMGLGTLYNYYVNKTALVYDLVDEDWILCCKEMRNASGVHKQIENCLGEMYVPLAEFVKKHKEVWVNALLAGPMTLGGMSDGRYSPEKYYRDIYNILRLMILDFAPDFEDIEYICRFISLSMCRHAAEYGNDYGPLGQIFKKLFVGVNAHE